MRILLYLVLFLTQGSKTNLNWQTHHTLKHWINHMTLNQWCIMKSMFNFYLQMIKIKKANHWWEVTPLLGDAWEILSQGNYSTCYSKNHFRLILFIYLEKRLFFWIHLHVFLKPFVNTRHLVPVFQSLLRNI